MGPVVSRGYSTLRRSNNVRYLAALFLGSCLCAIPPQSEAAQSSNKYSPSATCDQGKIGGKFILDGYTYSLTDQILSPGTIEEDVLKLSGGKAKLVAWHDLKLILERNALRSRFIEQLMLPVQSNNYDCGNILLQPISKDGNKFPIFFAYHKGQLLHDWRVLDEVGNHEIDVGSWSHSGRALIREKQEPIDNATGTQTEAQASSTNESRTAIQTGPKSDPAPAKASIYVTILQLADGHSVYSGLDTQSPILCIKGIANARRTLETRGFDSNPEYIQMEMVAKKTWNTDIVAMDWQCLNVDEYNKTKNIVGEKYWFPLRNF